MSGFAKHAQAWTAAGWGSFPLPDKKKSPPPQGWTGRGAPYPSGADVQAWAEEDPEANLGLRLPPGVIGIDVDDYDGKHGLATLAAASRLWGKLPPAPRITSRPGTRSGIYLYRTPFGRSTDKLLGEIPGGNVEIIRAEHRYCVGPGSTHPEGREYLLVFPPAEVRATPVATRGPIRVEDLPNLPVTWFEGLTVEEKAPAPDISLTTARGDAYTQSAVEHIVAELRDIAGWPDGKTDEKGRGWEKIQADAAYRLASLALADWNTLTLDAAMRAFGAAAPTGGGWTGADIAAKWRSQVRRAAPADPPKTQNVDPLAPGFQVDWSAYTERPAVAEFEEMVSDGTAVGDRDDDRERRDPGDVGVAAVLVPDGGMEDHVPEVPTAPPPAPVPSAPLSAVPSTLDLAAAEWVKHTWDDMGNAERVVALFGSRLRYLPSTDRWMAYDESAGRWEEDKLGGERAVAQMIERLPQLEAGLYSTTEWEKTKGKKTSDRKEFLEWVATQRFNSRCVSGARQIRAAGLLNDSPAAFDAHPLLLNCRNGVVDLRTGELRKHDPALRLRRQIPVAYDPNARAPLWDAYVTHAHPDVELQAYLQRIVGYSISGSTSEQVFFIHQGPPNTGKSMFLNVMTRLMGDLARVIPSTTLMAKKSEGHPTEIMGLAGRRMLTSSESAEGARLDAALVKRLSGSDFITARGMGQDFQDFRLVGKIHLATNHLPHIPDDEALQRRIHVVPWRVIVPIEEIDDELEENILRTELAGVLAWAVRGAVAWREQRLSRPPEAHLATLDYFEEEDEFGLFISETLVPAEVVWTSNKVLYRYYLQWCSGNNVRPMSRVQFGRKMAKKGFTSYRQGSDRGYHCTLRNDPVAADPLA